MPGNPDCSVYIGNLDERVNDRVLYEILIQAGHVIDLYIPQDKETNRPKGFAFAEYENEESAGYAVRLFSGLVSLYNRTLKFAISGQDKPPQNSASPMVLASNSPPIPRSQPMQLNNSEISEQAAQLLTPCRFSAYTQSVSPGFSAYPLSISPSYPQGGPLIMHASGIF
ncbi:spliceosome-associated protein 49-like isoform X2 [Magnolia sinica]|uniref:spliceosome-associated protein 49-like isoform X2 n=1 Tax=Magnolia sinica TaxID=86752 RepID=UPI002659000C|nr:spliceosome-associated protein 49-like isoform X2 [Magnolia sinica]